MRKVKKVWLLIEATLIISAIIWWAWVGNLFLRIPAAYQNNTEYSGTMTWYFDPNNVTPYSPETAPTVGLDVKRQLISDDTLYTSGVAVFTENILFIKEDAPEPIIYSSRYAVNRTNRQNMDGPHAYAFQETIPANRSGNYYPLLPKDTNSEQVYFLWRDELGCAVPTTFLTEENYAGTDLVSFSSGGDQLYALPQEYCAMWGLPKTVPFDKLREFLSMEAGINLEESLTIVTPSLTVEDQIAVGRARSQSAPITYFITSNQYSLWFEPQSGFFISLGNVEEKVYMHIDYSVISGLLAVFNKYSADPRIGAHIQELSTKLKALSSDALLPAFSYQYSPKADTGLAAIEAAKAWNKQAAFWARVFPESIVLAGFLLLLVVELSWYITIRQHHNSF